MIKKFVKVVKLFLLISTISNFYSFGFSQPLSEKLFLFNKKSIAYDSGRNWEELSSIRSYRHNLDYNNPLYTFDFQSGLKLSGSNSALTFIDRSNFKKKFYSYIDLSVKKNQNPENKNSFLELDYSGFGYENDWVIVQIGRGKENWGSGNNISLAFNNQSNYYDYIMLSSDYGRLSVNYFHGFLERLKNKHNRYIIAKGFEWRNKKSFILGLSETVIYSGPNRSLDLNYFNPISSHLEIELNKRENFILSNSSNAVWQIHLDILLKKRFRISMNYLFDEFVIDPEIEIGKEHGRAYSFRFNYGMLNNKKRTLNLHLSLITVGTPTFRHSSYSNFVNGYKPLGWTYGSDGIEKNIGVSYFLFDKFLINLLIGFVNSGEETILNEPYRTYSDYQKGKFPSGKTTKVFYYKTYAALKFLKNFEISLNKELFVNKFENIMEIRLNYNFDTLSK